MIGAVANRAHQMLPLLRLRPFDTLTPEGRADERHRRVALSALASALAKILSIATALISVPLTLNYLGPERYGMWMTMSSLVAMLSFADLGIGNGLLNAVAGAHGRDDRRAIRGYVSSGFFILTIIAVVFLALFAAAYRFVPWFEIFNVKSTLAREEAGPALAVFVACFVLAIPTGIVQRVQMGLQRGFMASLWQCLASALGLIGVLVAIRLEAGLYWLVLAFVGAPLVASALNSIVFFNLLQRDIAPTIRAVSPAAVARNAVPEKMFSLVTMVLTMVLAPLWPAYGEARARGDHGWVGRTLTRSFLIAIGFSALLSSALVLLGPCILELWVGHAVGPPILLLLGLGLWKVIEAGGSALAVFLNGANVIRVQVVLSTLTAASALPLKIVLVHSIGISGVVWASVISFIIFSAIPLIFIVPKMINNDQKI